MATNHLELALEIVTDRSQEGSQFCKGFGGIGGILRYRVDFQSMEVELMTSSMMTTIREIYCKALIV